MKLAVLTAAIASIGLFGCSGEAQKITTDAQASVVEPGNVVKEFEVNENVLSATRQLRIESSTDTAFIKISTSIEWPVKLGTYNVEQLQTELLSRAYPTYSGNYVNDALNNYTTSINSKYYAITAGSEITEVGEDTMPEDGYTISHPTKVLNFTDKYISYSITTSEYTGGAHANTAVDTFTFDLEGNKVVDSEYMFKPNSTDSISKLIEQNLALQFGTTPDSLTEVGFNSNNVKMSKIIYVDNEVVKFIYNRYEIAPYSMGLITAELNSYELRDYLTPAGEKILGE